LVGGVRVVPVSALIETAGLLLIWLAFWAIPAPSILPNEHCKE
jgi:hypothetical protein